MKKYHLKWVRSICGWIIMLSSFGCASPQTPISVVSFEQETKVVNIQAGDFKFEPNNIQIPKTGTWTLQVENISDKKHNITINNPEGRMLKNVALPSKQRVLVALDLSEPGKYQFYCGRPFHSTLGMVGVIKVMEK